MTYETVVFKTVDIKWWRTMILEKVKISSVSNLITRFMSLRQFLGHSVQKGNTSFFSLFFYVRCFFVLFSPIRLPLNFFSLPWFSITSKLHAELCVFLCLALILAWCSLSFLDYHLSSDINLGKYLFIIVSNISSAFFPSVSSSFCTPIIHVLWFFL